MEYANLSLEHRKELEAEFRAWYEANDVASDPDYDYTSGERTWIAARLQT